MTVSPSDQPSGANWNRAEPPRTVEGLRELMLRIERGDVAISLGPKARDALARILELRGDPALLSITSLADLLGVNPSTLTRLARNLGYSGFGAFQQVVVSAMAAPGTFYTQQARTALESADTSVRSRATQLCRENQANIDWLIDRLDEKALTEAVGLIADAQRVSVLGIRQFHAFASFLVYGLRMIRSDVSLLDSSALGFAEGIAALSMGDTLVTASCSPYSVQVVEAAKAAAESGINVVAITDFPTSPLVAPSRVALLAPHKTSFISNSLTTYILLAECLINGCAGAYPDQAKAALGEREKMIQRLGIET